MAIKLTILLLGSLLLAQTIYSAPTDSSEENFLDEIGNIFKEIAGRFQIVKLTIDEVLKLDKLVKDKGTIVLKKVLEDPKVLEVKTDAMEKILKEIREKVDKLEKGDSESSSNVIEYLDFEELVDKFKKEKVENLTHEAEVIGNSLKEHGLEEFEKTVSDDFGNFVDEFVKHVETFVNKLNGDDNKDEGEMHKWYNKFVAEKDLNKKLEIFDDFFNSLDDSKENSK